MLWRRERPFAPASKPTMVPQVAQLIAQSLYWANTASKMQSQSVLTYQYPVMGHTAISLGLSSKAPFPHLLGPKSWVPNNIWGSCCGNYDECGLLDVPPQKTAFLSMINTLPFLKFKMSFYITFMLYMYEHTRSAQIPGARSPDWLNVVRWYLIYVGHWYGTCITSPSWHLKFWGVP
jgi:hypothetical protein